MASEMTLFSLVAVAAGVVIQIVSGVDYLTIPPGLFILLIPAGSGCLRRMVVDTDYRHTRGAVHFRQLLPELLNGSPTRPEPVWSVHRFMAPVLGMVCHSRRGVRRRRAELP